MTSCVTGDNALFFASLGRKPTRFEVQSDLKDMSFSKCGPKAWFVVVKRET